MTTWLDEKFIHDEWCNIVMGDGKDCDCYVLVIERRNRVIRELLAFIDYLTSDDLLRAMHIEIYQNLEATLSPDIIELLEHISTNSGEYMEDSK